MLRITPITHFAAGAEFRSVLFPPAVTTPKHIGVRFGLLVRIASPTIVHLARGQDAIEL
jgi:hypothetical protein